MAINAEGRIFISGYMRPADTSGNTTWSVTCLPGDDIVAPAEGSAEQSLYDLAMTDDDSSDE